MVVNTHGNMLVYHVKCNSQSWLGITRSMNQMNNWWSEIEILKQTIAEQQEQIQKAYIRIKELNERISKEILERKVLGLDNASMYD